MKRLILVILITICFANNVYAKSLADIINAGVDNSNDSVFSSSAKDTDASKYISTSIDVNLSNGTTFTISMMIPNGWEKNIINSEDNPIIKYISNVGDGEIILQYLLSYKIDFFDDELKKTLSEGLIKKMNAYDIKYDKHKSNEDILTFTYSFQNQSICRSKIFFHNKEAFMITVKPTNINKISISDINYIFDSMKY